MPEREYAALDNTNQSEFIYDKMSKLLRAFGLTSANIIADWYNEFLHIKLQPGELASTFMTHYKAAATRLEGAIHARHPGSIRAAALCVLYSLPHYEAHAGSVATTIVFLQGKFMIDTGASMHVCSTLAACQETTPAHIPITMAVGSQAAATLMGTIMLKSRLTIQLIEITPVLYVPSAPTNCFSLFALHELNVITTISNNKVTIVIHDRPILTGQPCLNDLYFLNADIIYPNVP
eukprot:Ihof_evm3s486 gene=Ihof_evmTU3s486